jgi:hypothetical protein
MKITRAVTHIRLCDANRTKMAALDGLAATYIAVCQQYVNLFCAETEPDSYADPCFSSPLSQRWQCVAIQQAAGIAKSWRSTLLRAQEDFADSFAAWLEEEHPPEEIPPMWTPWRTPTLKRTVIQANATVALLQPSQETSFAYWQRISTLEKGQPIFLPITLSAYHQRCLAGKRVDSSVTLIRKVDGWWLTPTYEKEVPLHTPRNAPMVGGM